MRATNLGTQFGVALTKLGIVILGVAALAVGDITSGKNATADDISQMTGKWTGESICQVQPSACHDEKVLYRIAKPTDDSNNVVRITAYKIVDGREVMMGSGDWTYDKQKGTLLWDGPGGVWKLIVQGNRMYGTLTLPDKTVFRRVTLKKEE